MPSLRPRFLKGTALKVERVAIKADRVVYLIVVPRRLRYPWGRSTIAYIGTSKRGMRRIAVSAAQRADKVLGLHGV